MENVDQFSVLFSGDRVHINEKSYPVGQLTVAILNLDETVIVSLMKQLLTLGRALECMLAGDTPEAIADAQQQLRDSLRLVFSLPIFRDLDTNLEKYDRAFRDMPQNRELWEQIMTPGSADRESFEEMASRLLTIPERLLLFRKQIYHMAKDYIDTMPRRNATAYANAFFLFYMDMLRADSKSNEPINFDQCFPLEVDFVPMADSNDENGGMLIAERARFKDVVDLLQVEFYRGLIHGNAPRRCHNCGRYFLLTEGYNTCYCNNIAPGETERTCRKVGAHRKEAQGKANRTPARKEYDRTYNRLKVRKQRGKISVSEWNVAVAQAQELLAMSERGELTDDELTRHLAEL